MITTIFAEQTDGRVQSSSADYQTARLGAGDLTAFASDNHVSVGQLWFAGYVVWQGLLEFDASSIPATDSVVSAVLELAVSGGGVSTPVRVEARDFDWAPPLTGTDFVAGDRLTEVSAPSAATLTWVPGDLARLTQQVLTLDPPNVAAPPTVDDGVGAFVLAAGNPGASSRRDWWLHEDTAGWTDARVQVDRIDPLHFGDHQELGNVIPQGGAVLRAGLQPDGKIRGVTLNNGVAFLLPVLQVGVWECNPDGSEFRNRTWSWDIFESLSLPYGFEAELTGNVVRARIFEDPADKPSWDHPEHAQVIDLDTIGDTIGFPTPTQPGMCGAIAAHQGTDPVTAVRLHRTRFDRLDEVGPDPRFGTASAVLTTDVLPPTGEHVAFSDFAAGALPAGLPGGVARLHLHSHRQATGDLPDSPEFVEFSSADTGGTALAPRLVVEHEDDVLHVHTGTGGTLAGGTAPVLTVPRHRHVATGGSAASGTAHVHVDSVPGGVLSNIRVLWDFNNDGRFTTGTEDVTDVFVEGEILTGRDFPSQLTGRAGPGEFRGTFRNDDNRFSTFNADSPLTQPPYSLDLGRRVRIVTAEAADPDPVLLARERFRQPDGPLGQLELPVGAAWAQPGPPWAEWVVDGGRATVPATGTPAIATVDIGASDYYAQILTGRDFTGGFNDLAQVGIVYRAVDEDNYSAFRLHRDSPGAWILEIVDVDAGAEAVTYRGRLQGYAGIALGILVAGHQAQPMWEGTAFGAPVPAPRAGATRVGIWGEWQTYIAPEVQEFHVWDRLPSRTDGVLWTGDLSELVTESAPGPNNQATVAATGWLARLATHRLPPYGRWQGASPGRAVGNLLNRAGLLHPPGQLAPANQAPADPVALDEMDTLDAIRLFETHAHGFLHESQEGPIGFDDKNARDGRQSKAVFSDDPSAQFSFDAIEPMEWRRELFNQVTAGISASAPRRVSGSWSTRGSTTEIEGAAPSATEPGDLIVAVVLAGGVAEITWRCPIGWEELTSGKPESAPGDAESDHWRIFAKVATGGEAGQLTTFGTANASVTSLAQITCFRDWYGQLDGGVHLGDEGEWFPPAATAPWDPAPSIIFSMRIGRLGNASVSGWDEQGYDGYFSGMETFYDSVSGANMCVQSTYKVVAAHGAEIAGAYTGDFSGFLHRGNRLMFIRGFNGNPPVSDGVETITVNDAPSQTRHNAVKSYVNDAYMFRNRDEARSYALEVLSRHKDPRPLLKISFLANKSPACRAQAARRRVGDRITLRANQTTGMGIDGDFWIEHIHHEFRDGQTHWRVTWELSPLLDGQAAPGDPGVLDAVGPPDVMLHRLDAADSVLAGSIDPEGEQMSVSFTGARWVSDDGRDGEGGYFPLDVVVGDQDQPTERMTVTGIDGVSSPQTFHVTRGVVGTPTQHSAGARVRVARPFVLDITPEPETRSSNGNGENHV